MVRVFNHWFTPRKAADFLAQVPEGSLFLDLGRLRAPAKVVLLGRGAR